MAKETTKREEGIDPEAIARWNSDGGAPGPLDRGANYLRSDDAVEFGCILVSLIDCYLV